MGICRLPIGDCLQHPHTVTVSFTIAVTQVDTHNIFYVYSKCCYSHQRQPEPESQSGSSTSQSILIFFVKHDMPLYNTMLLFCVVLKLFELGFTVSLLSVPHLLAFLNFAASFSSF